MSAGAGGRLHVIVDVNPGTGDRCRFAEAVLRAGAPVLQVRVKGLDDRTRYERTAPLADLCARHGAVCVVNDRADVAVALGAGGVHVGADDLPVAAVRTVVPATALVGGTARDPVAAARLERDGASYLGVGPVYPTTSKSGLPDPLGLDRLRAVADAVAIPVVAIAGITAARIPEVLAAGAHGVAVIGAVASADDPARATADLLDALERRP